MSFKEYAADSLIAPINELNFLHQDHRLINNNIKAIDAYYSMTAKSSILLNLAFRLRDLLGHWFGRIQPIHGFSSAKSEKHYKVGDKLDFFKIEKINDTVLYLTAIDKHLSILLVIKILQNNNSAQAKILITTSVKTHNLFGKIYMLPVTPAHGIIIRNMLKKLK